MSTAIETTEKQKKAIVPRIDKTTGRVDLAIALDKYYNKGWTFEEIGNLFGVSKQAVAQRMRKFISILQSPDSIKAFRDAKPQILDSIELKLLSQLVDDDKLKDASTNNIAYALKQVHEMGRLEKDLSTANIAEHMTFNVVSPDMAADRDRAQAAQFKQQDHDEDMGQPDNQED